MNRMVARNPHGTQGELYRLGAITTAFNLPIFLVVDTPWILFVTR